MLEIKVENLFDGRRFRRGPWLIQVAGDSIVGLREVSFAALNVKEHGKTALPGLIDAHVHLTLDCSSNPVAGLLSSSMDELSLLVEKHCRELVASGVTTVRDCGSGSNMVPVFRHISERSDHRYPTILAAGMPLTTPNGHCHFFGAGVERGELDAAIDALVRVGVDFIKVMVTGGGLTPGSDPRLLQYGEEDLRYIVERAKSNNLPVVAHVHTEEGVLAAARAGVRTVEHATGLRPCGIGISSEVAGVLADSGAYVTPTLSGFVTACTERIPGVQRATGITDPGRLIEERFDAVQTLIGCGNRLIAGTDAGTRHLHFNSIGAELRALHKAGLGAERVLAAATSIAASCLNHTDRGVIRISARADLTIVEADTLEGVLDRIEKPVGVLLGGREVFRR